MVGASRQPEELLAVLVAVEETTSIHLPQGQEILGMVERVL
jgi:hypothetical protein